MPSYSELTAVVGFRSKHAAYQLVQCLVAHEWVEKDVGARCCLAGFFLQSPCSGR